MKRMVKLFLFAFLLSVTFSGLSYGAVMTFDDLITGQTSYSFDADSDGIYDAVLSTTDTNGFNTIGPGPYMTYIQEPGLEGTTSLNPDLRIDFLTKAKDYIKFGFALDDFLETTNTWVDFKVYDSSGNLLGSDFEIGYYTYLSGGQMSSFPEGVIEVTFSGTAAYALFNFNNDASGGQRYIIDNFEGTYGTTEVPPVPEPTTMLLLGLGLVGLAGVRRKMQ